VQKLTPTHKKETQQQSKASCTSLTLRRKDLQAGGHKAPREIEERERERGVDKDRQAWLQEQMVAKNSYPPHDAKALNRVHITRASCLADARTRRRLGSHGGTHKRKARTRTKRKYSANPTTCNGTLQPRRQLPTIVALRCILPRQRITEMEMEYFASVDDKLDSR
jgi:hypothetical protein